MYVTSGIANLTSIPTRLHSDLQSLTSDDHTQYDFVKGALVGSSTATGLDASKSATPAVGDSYYATDTKKFYVCYATNTWVQIMLVAPATGAAQGDLLYYDGAKWARLAAGTSGYFLKSQGTGADPTFASPPTSYGMKGSQAGAYTTSSTSLVNVDGTHLTVTISGLTVGQLIYWWGIFAYSNNSNTGGPATVELYDTANSLQVASIISGNGATTGTGWSSGLYKVPATSVTITLRWNCGGNGSSSITNNAGADVHATGFGTNGVSATGFPAFFFRPVDNQTA